MVTDNPGVPKKRRCVRFDFCTTVRDMGIHNNDLPNILRGLRERVFAVEKDGRLVDPPRPAPKHFAGELRKLQKQLVRYLGPCLPCSDEVFLSHYKGAKHARYRKAIEENYMDGCPRWAAYLSTFVKAESINFDSKPDPAPRVIQPRHPRYNAAVGRYIQPLERRVYRALGKMCGGPTVMKGYNADMVGKIINTAWCSFEEPVAVSLDASRFDQHVSVDALRLEHDVYIDAYKNSVSPGELEEFKKLLSWQVDNKGYAHLPEATVKYEVKGNRMSGDMNTALGNCLLMCLMVKAYCDSKQVGFRLMDNGDDATVIIERTQLAVFLDGLKEWFLKMGFTMKVEEPVYHLEGIEFCQTHPVLVGNNYRMVRNPITALSKDALWKAPAFSGERVDPKSANAWLHAVGECGLSLCSGVPVMESYYTYYTKHAPSKGVQGFGNGESGFERMGLGMRWNPIPILPANRVSFWLAFGITPDQQELLEGQFGRMAITDFHQRRIKNDSLNHQSSIEDSLVFY